jgi:hypothetical protein
MPQRIQPLGVLPKTHADVHEETVAEEHYQEANIKTVTDMRKHSTRGPPPIPNNDAELLRLNTRDVTVLTGFFTKWSSLVKQETAPNDGIQAQHMDLFSRPDSTREMIPHFLWAKIRARRKFFLQTCTREMLDVPPEKDPSIACLQHPHTAKWASMRRFLVRDAADPKTMATCYRTVVLYVLLYGSESWVLTSDLMRQHRSFHRRCCRGLTGEFIRQDEEWEWICPYLKRREC